MRPTRAAVTALVWLSIVSCHGRNTQLHARNALRSVVQATVAALPTRSIPIPGAALRIAHPNAQAIDRDLGVHVTPRNLALPRVRLGESARFRIDGGRRGWVLQLANHELLATPAYANGKVFVGAGFSSKTVYALDSQTGTLRWAAETPDGGPTAALIDDDSVLFNTESCTLFSFSVRTGRLRWSRWLGDPLMSQPAAANGRVYSAYPSAESPTGFAFAAMSTRTGTILWTRPIAGDILTAPVIDGNAVYFSTMDGTVYRFSADRGRRVWAKRMNATSAPAINGERLYVAQRQRGGRERQVALATATGASLSAGEPTRAAYASRAANAGGVAAGWSYEGSRPSFADGRLYYAMGDDLVARDVETGGVVWQRHYANASSRRGVTSPAISGSVLVVGTRDGNLFGLDIDTGMTTWAYHVGEPIAFQPTVANGWVYAATASGKVIGLEVADRSFDGWHMWGGNAKHNGPSPSEPAPTVAEEHTGQGTLRSATGEETAFPLLHTSIHAEVSGFVARVSVEQTFTNPFTRALDAEYVLPLPADSAVDAMDFHIGDRVVHGEIQRRGEARERFQTARACGQRAALLEQDRPNLFRQSVANIGAGETVRVVLRFATTVPYQEGTYELALPLSSGSRYTPGAGGTTPTRPPGDVDVTVRVDVGIALESVESPSHTLTVTHDNATAVTATLASATAAPDRDFVLRYRPRVAAVEPSVLADGSNGDGYFTLMLHPNAQAPDGEVTPRELVFAVDASSSMRGAPLLQAQTLLHRAVDRLRTGDTIRILRFSDTVTEASPQPLGGSLDERARAHEFVNGLQAAGATEMLPAIAAALHGASDPARVRMVVLITDGFIGNDTEVLAAVERDLGTSRVFAFGVGTAVNRYLLEQLAEVGRGHAEVITPSEDAGVAADRFHARIDRPYLTDVSIDWGGLEVAEVYPRVVPDLFAARPVLVHGRYHHAGSAEVRIRGRIHGQAWSRSVHVTLPETAHDHQALPSVWARARIHDLSRAMLLGETTTLRDEVTQLGLQFSLVTDYTSFVAIDNSGVLTAACRGHVPASSGGVGFGYGAGGVGSGAMAYGFASASGSISGVMLSGRSVTAPMVRASPPSVQGLASPEPMRATVRRHLPEIQHCYQRELAAHPQLGGRVALRLMIGPDGSVLAAVVSEDSLGNPAVSECMLQAARSWSFGGMPDGGGVVTMTYPFLFTPPDPSEVEPSPTRFVVPLSVD